jgi:hypothetical protein
VDSQCTKYYVVFTDSDIKRAKWMKPNFRHCYLIRKDFDCLWTIVSGGWNQLSITQESALENTIDDILPHECTVVEYDAEISYKMAHTLNISSCVGVVKYMLGINKHLILTPYQLYKHLKRV